MPRSIRVDVLVVLLTISDGALKTLLTRAGAGAWALPSGTPAADEPLRKAAERAVADQLGARVDYLEQLYTFGNAIPPAGTPRVIEVSYYGLVPPELVQIPAADGPKSRRKLGWFAEAEQPELAGDHALVTQVARRRLRGKLAYSAVGFELLPEEFTLSDLRRLYEIILGKEIDKRNFWRKVHDLGIVEPTGNTRRNPRGRHAELFRFRPEVFKMITAKGDILAF